MEPARGWFSVLLTELKGTLGPTVDRAGSDDLRRDLQLREAVGSAAILTMTGMQVRTLGRACNFFPLQPSIQLVQ
jgi:hypothetical protein